MIGPPDRPKDYDLVQTVDELRGKLPAGRRDTDARHLVVEFIEAGFFPHWRLEAHTRTGEGTHVGCAEIAGQKDHR